MAKNTSTSYYDFCYLILFLFLFLFFVTENVFIVKERKFKTPSPFQSIKRAAAAPLPLRREAPGEREPEPNIIL